MTKHEIKQKLERLLIETGKDGKHETGRMLHYILDSLLADREELLWAISRLPHPIKEKVQTASENRMAKILGTLQ